MRQGLVWLGGRGEVRSGTARCGRVRPGKVRLGGRGWVWSCKAGSGPGRRGEASRSRFGFAVMARYGREVFGVLRCGLVRCGLAVGVGLVLVGSGRVRNGKAVMEGSGVARRGTA